ncbi:hypothetical protein [Mycobacterium lepromatosis]|nr:hypothetical protein [Mycobacterium lepromatosis]
MLNGNIVSISASKHTAAAMRVTVSNSPAAHGIEHLGNADQAD